MPAVTSVINNEPIISVDCDEPKGLIRRNVRLMSLNRDALTTFWEKARVHKTLFNEEIRNSYEKFVERILYLDANGQLQTTGLFWVVDDFVGVFYVTDIKPGIDANVHYTFFDGRHQGRTNLVKAMLRYGFQELGFRRLTVELPSYTNEKIHNFVTQSVGFTKEGVKRKAKLLDGKYFDVTIYGMLREEILH